MNVLDLSGNALGPEGRWFRVPATSAGRGWSRQLPYAIDALGRSLFFGREVGLSTQRDHRRPILGG